MNALTTIPEPAPMTKIQIRSLDDYVRLGEIFGRSGLFADARDANKCVVKILAGAEMGFGPLASMSDVHVVEGKPCIGAHLRAAAIKRSGKYDYRVRELTREACSLEFFESGKPVGIVEITMKEAVDTGLAVGKDGKIKTNWARHGDDMLFARCISKGFRRYCPDLTGGVLAYDPDELEHSGQVIEAEAIAKPGVEHISMNQRQEITNILKRRQDHLGMSMAEFVRSILKAIGVEKSELIPAAWFPLVRKMASSPSAPSQWYVDSFGSRTFASLSNEEQQTLLAELDEAQE